MSRRLLFPLLMLGSLAGVTGSACVLDADGFSSGGLPPGADSGPTGSDAGLGGDGSPQGAADTGTSPVSDGGSDAGGVANILVNGDFELGCAGWEAGFGFLSESNVAHTGTKSCKFCMDTNYKASIARQGPTTAVAGKTYYAEIWMKGVETPSQLSAKGYNGSSLNLYIGNDDGAETPGPVTAADWVKATTLFTLPRGGSTVGISLNFFQDGNPAAVGNVICLYVDDAVVRPID